MLEGELEKVKSTEADNPTSSLNQRLHALYRASTVALKVSTGEEGRRSLALVSIPFKLASSVLITKSRHSAAGGEPAHSRRPGDSGQ